MPHGGGRSWRSLKNWRVRSRLLLLIIIPTLTAVILGGTYIVTSVAECMAYQRVERLANLSYDVTGLAARLEDERDETMQYIGLGSAGRLGCADEKHHGRRAGGADHGRSRLRA